MKRVSSYQYFSRHGSTQWRFKNGSISQRIYYDDQGNSYPFKVCTFVFDQLHLAGDLEIVISGDASLNIQITGSGYLGSKLTVSGGHGGQESYRKQDQVVMQVVPSMKEDKVGGRHLFLCPRRCRLW